MTMQATTRAVKVILSLRTHLPNRRSHSDKNHSFWKRLQCGDSKHVRITHAYPQPGTNNNKRLVLYGLRHGSCFFPKARVTQERFPLNLNILTLLHPLCRNESARVRGHNVHRMHDGMIVLGSIR